MTLTTNFKRLVCCLLAVLMLCTCVIRPLEVKAVALEAGIGLGVAVILILATAGIVLHPKTAEQVVEIGRSLQDDLERKYGDTEEKLENIRKWCNEIDEQIRNRPDAPDDPEWSNTAIKLSRAALTAISAWIASVIAKGGVEVEYNDYACYNGALLPLIDTVWDKELYPYAFIQVAGSIYCVRFSSALPYTDGQYVRATNANYSEYDLSTDGTKWVYYKSRTGYTGPFFTSDVYLWSNCDILSTDGSLFASASEPLYETEEIIEYYRVPGSPLEDENGEPDPEEIEENLPEVIYPSRVLYDTQKTDLTEAVREVVRQLSEGEMTYEQYMEQVQGELGEVPGEGTGTGTGTQVGTGTIAGSSLATVIDAIFDAVTLPIQLAISTSVDVIRAIFVPSEDFLTAKVEALASKFGFAAAIVETVNALKDGLNGVTTEPPVIYLDLGASRGSYELGGKVPFLDLTWYAEYKPTVDKLISAFLWLCFIWRMFLKLPGIISGMPGDFVAGFAQDMGLMNHMPSRSADLARERIEIRQSIWKGRK